MIFATVINQDTMYRIITIAKAMDLLGNLEPIRIQTDNEQLICALRVSDADGTALDTIELSYTPAAGEVRIDLREIVRPYFQFALPTGNVTAQPRMLLTVTLTFMREASHAMQLTILRGGVDNLEETPAAWIKANAFTAQPRTKRVAWNQPEYLTLYLEKEQSVMATPRVRPTLGAEPIWRDSVVMHIAETAGIYTLNVSMQYLAEVMSLGDGEQLINIDLKHNAKTLMRYVPDPVRSEDERWFFWQNSLGGLDTMRCTGAETLTAEPEAESADYDDSKQTYRVESPRSWNQNTGVISSRERLWLLDFLQSPYRYVYRLGALLPITVEEASVESATADEAYDFDFSYRLARMPRGMEAHLMSEAPTAAAPSWLSPVDFPSAPLPAEWEMLTPGEGLVIPTLIAGTHTWGALSYGALVDDVAKRIKRWVEDYIRQQVAYHMGTGPLAYTFECLSSHGNTFYNSAGSTELRAVVRRGFIDVTDKIPTHLFSWVRISSYPENDAVFNAAHVGFGPRLTITPSDIYKHACFEYRITIQDIEDALRGVVLTD